MDLRKPEVLLAWRAVMAVLEAHGQPDGLAALLLKDYDAETKSAEARFMLKQARLCLPKLVSSTRQIDVSCAVAAALPLTETGSGMTPSWNDFLMGYICGLRASPLLGARCELFLGEFGEAIGARSSCNASAGPAWAEHIAHTGRLPWVQVVLEAISYGSVTLSGLLAKRGMSIASGTDTMFGAMLGSVLWRDCPYESELVDRLCGCVARTVQ